MNEKCAVCGEDARIGFMGFGGNYGGTCRICERVCCWKHFDRKEQLCSFCKEKMR